MNRPLPDMSRSTLPESYRQAPLSRRHLWQLGAAAALASGAVTLLPEHAAAATATGAAATTTPATAQDYFERATRLAGDDPVRKSMVAALTAGFVLPAPAAPAPMMIFDNVAVLSVGWVSAVAIRTSAGIVLIDALTSSDDAAKVLVPGLQALGADPSTIKYIVVAHAHRDHFGGANYLAEQYGARVMMAPADWDFLAARPTADAPTRDLDIADGQKLTVGDTTISLHHTPGHTPGTISPIFPAHWKGRKHTAMLWGGTNPPAATGDKQTYLSSVLTFASRMKRAGVDVELSNHGFSDYGLERMAALRAAPAGARNPFVVGGAGTQRLMKVIETMLRGRIAADQAAAPGPSAAADLATTTGPSAAVAVAAAPIAASDCC